ncbi:MAG: hypothetical protein LQ348_002533 [Seirophora lacunosa]|nr:MAG: hypothetical protein LQ348_002533 [Seirophora lacunosa]
MAEGADAIVFNEPNYNPDDPSGRTDRAIARRRPRNGSPESTSSGARKNPSLVAREVRNSTDRTARHRSSTISDSTVQAEGTDFPTSIQFSPKHSSARQSTSFPHTTLRESVDTQDVLLSFAPVAAENEEKEREREARLQKHGQLPPDLTRKLQQLKTQENSHNSWLPASWPWRAVDDASDNHDAKKRLAKFHLPYRSDVKVLITDIKEHSADSRECRLSEITKYMDSKPSDVQVRWIHAPLGLGPLHSTVEDLFLHQGEVGRPLKNLGRSGWPYAKVEVLNFLDRGHFQNMRDVYHLLHGDAELTKELDGECWTAFEPSSTTEGKGLLDDLRWRNTHLGLADDWQTLPDYWTASTSDVPWQITEGVLMSNYGPLDGLQPTLWQSDRQALHNHRFFGSAQLLRDVFRCFHRGDGFLLTLSGMRGVNYLDRHFERHLGEPRDAIFDNDVASAIAFVRQQFKDSGTQKWHRASAEWLLVHLMTEIGATPHVDRQGCNAPTLEGAYQEVIQQFKRRQYEHFDRKNPNEPAELIKDMLICKEELRRIKIMSKNRERTFELLGMDVKELEGEDLGKGLQPDHQSERSASDKIQDALKRAERQTEAFELLLDDIGMSLTSVYDLRSIQQRQGGIITAGQQRALVLIALVQLVFIPCQTLCGYWGMNLVDIRQSSWDQHDFWQFCASIVLPVALSCTIVTATNMAWQRRQSLRKEYRRGTRLFTGPANDRLDCRNPV